MLHKEPYCRESTDPIWLADIESMLLGACVASLRSLKYQDMVARKNGKAGIPDYSVSKKDIYHCIGRTIDDLHIVKLRQNPRKIENYTAAGLFSKHVMDLQPLVFADAEEGRLFNAHLAICVSISMLLKDRAYGDIDTTIVENEMIIRSLKYYLAFRNVCGEALGLIYLAIALRNK